MAFFAQLMCFCDAVHFGLLPQSKAVHPSLNCFHWVEVEHCTCFQSPVQGEINVNISVDLSGARISPTQSKLNMLAIFFFPLSKEVLAITKGE